MTKPFRIFLLLCLLLVSIKTTWAHQFGPTIIRECPKCNVQLQQDTTLSGNTFGASFWTDSGMDAPMLPYHPKLVKCPKCGVFIWIDEAKKLGEREVGRRDNKFPDAIEFDSPTEADYLHLLNSQQLSIEKELYLRYKAWWAGNDTTRINGYKNASWTSEQKRNLLALASLMKENDPNQRITKAEIFRELQRYDDCIKLLEQPFADKYHTQVATFIKKLAEQESWMVQEIMFPSERVAERIQKCNFSGLKLPSKFSVFAASVYSGRELPYQIDQSGHEGHQIDVTVNSPDRAVVLFLGTYEPTIWNIKWTQGTKVLAAAAFGFHRQVIAGLDKKIPILTGSVYENPGSCHVNYPSIHNLSMLRLFAIQILNRPIDMAFPAKKESGSVIVGNPVTSGTKLFTSTDTTPESYCDKSAPLAGTAGLKDAVSKGVLRRATAEDAKAWTDAVCQNLSDRNVSPVAGMCTSKPLKISRMHAPYVVLKPFIYPSGLYGANSATFFIPKGVSKPTGNPGHSTIYDCNTLNCKGPLCGVDQ